jgi:hypothetical protein
MNEQNLLIICLSAFAAVLVLLSVLALAMRALIAVFPAPAQPGAAGVAPVAGAGDPALAAAIAMTARALFPGAQLTRIEPVATAEDDSRKDSV